LWHAWEMGEVFRAIWLGRIRHRWEDNMQLDLREIWIDWAKRIQVVQDRDTW